MIRDILRGIGMLLIWVGVLIIIGFIGRLIYEPIRFGWGLF
jgi:hypothetical protein